ncbi:unnamed protein product [Brugia pahangi]|uniref:Uncharacterized protein n=1 Tax=Brugia pahangi TaxID=6280 RepID=A0A0N4SXY1_BRUPA|nr:unnamed protein product [Brugia pahangi]
MEEKPFCSDHDTSKQPMFWYQHVTLVIKAHCAVRLLVVIGTTVTQQGGTLDLRITRITAHAGRILAAQMFIETYN